MAETAKYIVESELGCGLIGSLFLCRSSQRAKTSKETRPTSSDRNKRSIHKPRMQQTGSGEAKVFESLKSAKPSAKVEEKPITKRTLPLNPGRRTSDAARSSTSSSNGSCPTKVSQGPDKRRQRRDSSFSSNELSMTLYDPLQSSASQSSYAASSGNVKLLGHLGNLKQLGTKNSMPNSLPNTPVKALGYGLRSVQEARNGRLGSGTIFTGSVVRKASGESPRLGNNFGGLMSKSDPEVLKLMGNVEYQKGRFEEALAFYNQAIALDSTKASFYSNKGAALICLGRIIEAVFECREAIRIEPRYHRAHHRLARLYLRLGEAEKALDHYKQAGPKADYKDIPQAQALKTDLTRCTEAREREDWKAMLKESQCAIASGAGSAPQIYAMQVEALLKILRHQEAYTISQKGPNFDIDSCSRLFGAAVSAYILIIRAQVYMAAGRFEDAVAAAQNAARLDSRNEINAMVRRVRAVASARSAGNQLFKASKYTEASLVYSEGLDHEPYNSILLCNRAACRSKLGQFEKAIEDCTAALYVRPSYSKARLRRADCNAKLEKWEAAIQDYEMLIRETPGDEEVGKALFESQIHLRMQRGEDIKDMKFGSNLVIISNNERFKHFITAPGMSVVLFCNKRCHKQVLQLMEQVCKRFPSVNFLKVEIEDNPYLAKSEGLSSIPAFKIYKNGSKIKEIPGNNRELLEKSVKLYSG